MDEVLCAMGDSQYTVLELSESTGRLRNSVWKALRALVDEGFVVREKAPPRGTCGRRPYVYKIK